MKTWVNTLNENLSENLSENPVIFFGVLRSCPVRGKNQPNFHLGFHSGFRGGCSDCFSSVACVCVFAGGDGGGSGGWGRRRRAEDGEARRGGRRGARGGDNGFGGAGWGRRGAEPGGGEQLVFPPSFSAHKGREFLLMAALHRPPVACLRPRPRLAGRSVGVPIRRQIKLRPKVETRLVAECEAMHEHKSAVTRGRCRLQATACGGLCGCEPFWIERSLVLLYLEKMRIHLREHEKNRTARLGTPFDDEYCLHHERRLPTFVS